MLSNSIIRKFNCRTCGRACLEVADNQERLFVISLRDKQLLEEYWRLYQHRNTWYVLRATRGEEKRRTILLHRVINKTPRGLVVDHLNGDGSYNCRCNLENVTAAVNNSSQRRHNPLPNNTGKPNIHKLKKGGFQINVCGKRIIAGTLAEAIDWRDALLGDINIFKRLQEITKKRREVTQF